MEPVSWRPRAFVFHNFMTEAEADHIVALAKPFVSPLLYLGACLNVHALGSVEVQTA